MISPSNTEGDSADETPLLDVQIGGPRTTVIPTCSYAHFVTPSLRMELLYEAILSQRRRQAPFLFLLQSLHTFVDVAYVMGLITISINDDSISVGPSFWYGFCLYFVLAIAYSTLVVRPIHIQPTLGANARQSLGHHTNPFQPWMKSVICSSAIVLVPTFIAGPEYGSFLGFLLLIALSSVAEPINRKYYDKHGPVQFTAMIWEREKWFFDRGWPVSPFRWPGSIHINLGVYHVARGEYGKAIDCYRKVFHHFPYLEESLGGVVLHKEIGKACYKAGRYEEALDHFSKANLLRKRIQEQQPGRWSETRLGPRINRDDYHNLGLTYMALGRNDEALENFQQAVEVLKDTRFERDKEFAESLAKVGELHEIIGNKRDAVMAYREALKIHLLYEGEFPRATAVAMLYDKLGDLRGNKDEDEDEDGDGETAYDHWNMALEVYRRNGKTDEDIELTRLQSKVQENLDVV